MWTCEKESDSHLCVSVYACLGENWILRFGLLNQDEDYLQAFSEPSFPAYGVGLSWKSSRIEIFHHRIMIIVQKKFILICSNPAKHQEKWTQTIPPKCQPPLLCIPWFTWNLFPLIIILLCIPNSFWWDFIPTCDLLDAVIINYYILFEIFWKMCERLTSKPRSFI